MIKTQNTRVASLRSSDKNIDHKVIEQYLFLQYNIARILAESNSISKAAGQVLKIICKTIGWDFGALWRVEPETHTITNEGVWHSESAGLSDYSETILYSVLNDNEASLPAYVLPEDSAYMDPQLKDFNTPDARKAGQIGLTSGFLLPIQSGNNLMAILECLTTDIQPQDHNLSDMLHALGNQIGIFMKGKKLDEMLAIHANQHNLLAEADLALSSSLDFEERLKNIMHVIVPDMADWCAIDLIDQDKILRRVNAVHVDPDKLHLVYALQPSRVIDFNAENRQIKTLLSGQSLLFTDVSSSLIENTIVDPNKLEIIHQLDPKSFIVVPLMAHNRILGICTFVQSDSRRHYLSTDLTLAEVIGRRVALALDNAILYAESKKYNAELERHVESRTAQLIAAINQLTNQITERQYAEEQVKILNAELEHRIAERTSELEVANQNLQKEVLEHQQASQTLRISLKRMRELYRISQAIGSVRVPNEVLRVLLSSSYLKNISRASIAILEKPWIENEQAPKYGFIQAEWNKHAKHPTFTDQRFTLEELGVTSLVPFGQPIVIQDIQSVGSLSENARKRFANLGTHGLIILPLVAGGEWYGLLSLHFRTHWTTNLDDLRHVRGLVDETAIAIKNIRLLETKSQARLEAEKANELKLKFLAMISHELRTPLASIKGFATTLLSEDVVWSPDKQKDFLQTIDSEADKLSDLIEQLLDLSRMEAGTLRILPQKQNLQKIISSALAQIHAVTSEHKLVLDISPDLPSIYGDQQRIAQVLTNLIGNAAKYSPSQTQITVAAHQTNEYMVQIDVADQGIGIPPEKRNHIFKAFQQLENGTGSYNRGAGLGLAICKGLIEAHGGTIWIQDRPSPGSVISFTVPISMEQNKVDANIDRL